MEYCEKKVIQAARFQKCFEFESILDKRYLFVMFIPCKLCDTKFSTQWNKRLTLSIRKFHVSLALKSN